MIPLQNHATFSSSIQSYKFHFILTILFLAGLYGQIFQGMVADWYHDDNYSHCFLVPVIAGYLLWQRMGELKESRVAPADIGLAIIALALTLLILASLSTEFFTLRSSLVLLIAGIVIYLFGTEVFRIARLSIFYLIFMVPIPYIVYDSLAFPLKLFVTKCSVWFLKAIGIVVLREGNIIMFPSTMLEVADACSGIRSLVSLLALAVAYAFIINSSPFNRWIIIISAVPIAVFTNAIRVIGTGILAQYWGAKAAEGFFHEFAGLAVFSLGIVLLVGLGSALNRWNPDSGGDFR